MVSANIIENTCSQSGLFWCKFARVYSGAALLSMYFAKLYFKPVEFQDGKTTFQDCLYNRFWTIKGNEI